MALTRITKGVIKPNENYDTHNINSTGIITATKFVGTIETSNATITGGSITAATGTFSGNVSIGGTLTYEDVTNIDSVGLITARDGLKVLAGGANVVGVVTITDGVVTTNNLLTLKGTSWGDEEKVFTTYDRGSVHLGRFGVEADGAGQAGQLIFECGYGGSPVERVRINSLGRVGIGTINPVEVLHVLQRNNSAAEFRLENNEGYILLRSDNNLATYDAQSHIFRSRDGSDEYGKFDTDGRFGIGTNNPTGTLTIASGTFQSTTPTSTGDDIVISGNNSLGMQFLTLASNTSNNNIYFGDTDDPDVGMIRYAHANNSLQFQTNTEERLRITSDGELQAQREYAAVGINTFARFARKGNGGPHLEIGYNAVTSDYGYFGTGSAHGLGLRTNDTTALFIDTSQKVGIGTNNPQQMLDVRGNVVIGIDQVSGNPGTTVGITTIRGHHVNSVSDFAQLYFSNSKSAGGGTAPTASIRAIREGDNYGTSLSFYTNSAGSAGDGLERLRILSNGRIGIGTDTAPRDMVHIHNPAANASSYIQFTNANTAGTGINDGTLIGISQNNSNTDGTGSGFTILQKENAEITLGTNNLERLRINSAGTVRIKRAVSSSMGNDSIFLAIGDTENGANVNRMIGFGYNSNFGTSVYPASIGYTESDNSGNTRGHLIFATRNTTGATDVPTERLRIQTSGKTSFSYDATPANAQYGQIEISKNGASNADPDWSYLSFHRVGQIAWQQGIDSNGFVIAKTGGGTKDTLDTERLRITSTGNIGQSVTPSGWSTAQANDFFAYQIGSGMAMFGRGSGDLDRGGISCNYYNTASAQKYIGNGHAGRIYFEDGSIVFSNAAQNSAGADQAMTLNERLKIDPDGVLTTKQSNTNANSTNWNGAAIGIQNTHDTDSNASVLWFQNSAGGIDSGIQGIHEDAAGSGGARRGHIQFGTSGSDSSGSCVERLRIESHGDVAINTTDGDFGQTNGASNFAKGDPKLGVLGSIAIGNFSTTTTDFSQLSFYRRHGATAGANGRLQSTHNLGRISWNGASNDTSFPDDVCSIQAVATGGDWWGAAARRATLQFHQYHGEALRIVNSNTQNYSGSSADNRYAEVQVRHKTPYSTDGGYPGGNQTSTNQINFSIYNEHYGGNRLAFRSGGASQFELETKTRDVGSGSYNDADVYFRSQYDGTLSDRIKIHASGSQEYKSRDGTMMLNLISNGGMQGGQDPDSTLWDSGSQSGWHYNRDGASFQVATRANSGYSNVYLNKNTGAGGSTDYRYIEFYWNTSQVGRISYNGSGNTNYGTSSDYRRKENNAAITDGIVKVKQLKPIRFNFKGQPADKVSQGFLAHEAQEIVPNACSGTKDGMKTDERGDSVPEYQQVDYGQFTPILTAALQEAIAKIEVLEAKVAALEGS